MQPHILELESQSLSLLGPQLRSMSTVLETAPPGVATDPASDTPTMVIARSVSVETLPAIRTAVAKRFGRVADHVDRACAHSADAEVDLTASIAGVNGKPPPRGSASSL